MAAIWLFWVFLQILTFFIEVRMKMAAIWLFWLFLQILIFFIEGRMKMAATWLFYFHIKLIRAAPWLRGQYWGESRWQALPPYTAIPVQWMRHFPVTPPLSTPKKPNWIIMQTDFSWSFWGHLTKRSAFAPCIICCHSSGVGNSFMCV